MITTHWLSQPPSSTSSVSRETWGLYRSPCLMDRAQSFRRPHCPWGSWDQIWLRISRGRSCAGREDRRFQIQAQQKAKPR